MGKLKFYVVNLKCPYLGIRLSNLKSFVIHFRWAGGAQQLCFSEPSPRIDPGGNPFLWGSGPSRDPKVRVHTHQVWGQLQLHFSKLLCRGPGSGPGTFAHPGVHPDPGRPKTASKNPLPHLIVSRSEFRANPPGGSGVIGEQSFCHKHTFLFY